MDSGRYERRGWLGSLVAAFCLGLNLFGKFTRGKQQITSGPRIPSHLLSCEWMDTTSPLEAPTVGRSSLSYAWSLWVSREPVFRRLRRIVAMNWWSLGSGPQLLLRAVTPFISLVFNGLSSQSSLRLLFEVQEARWFSCIYTLVQSNFNRQSSQICFLWKKNVITVKLVTTSVWFTGLLIQVWDKYLSPDYSPIMTGKRSFTLNPDTDYQQQNCHFQGSPIMLSVPLAGGVQDEVL